MLIDIASSFQQRTATDPVPLEDHLGSGPINFGEMADKWRKYARKTVQDGLKPVQMV
jgi:hypothetical protein